MNKLKQEIIARLVEKIAEEMAALRRLQEQAALAATHEESKPENEHDTRAVEASYLAAGQAQRYEVLRRTHSVLQQFPLRDFAANEAIAAGALVELSLGSEKLSYFLATVAGGYKVECGGKTIHILTPESKLGQELLDKYAGDEVEITTKGKRVYTIESIA